MATIAPHVEDRSIHCDETSKEEVSQESRLGYLAQVATTLLEKGEHEERLAAVEVALGPRLRFSGRRR